MFQIVSQKFAAIYSRAKKFFSFLSLVVVVAVVSVLVGIAAVSQVVSVGRCCQGWNIWACYPANLFNSNMVVIYMIEQYLFLNGPTPAPFSFIFGLFKQTSIQLQQINVKKCPTSLRHRDSNPQPFKHELSPITTRPGLPSKWLINTFRIFYFTAQRGNWFQAWSEWATTLSA